MADNRGSGSYSSLGRWCWIAQSRRGLKILAAVGTDEQASLFFNAHKVTEALQRLGERFRQIPREQINAQAQFEYESKTGQISLKIFDTETGELQVKLSPEEVVKGLLNLEDTPQNGAPLSFFLSSFFVDVTI